jgi:hypothetical protein
MVCWVNRTTMTPPVACRLHSLIPPGRPALPSRCGPVRANFGMKGSWKASVSRRTLVGPRPGQRESSCSLALIMRASEPKVACSVATCHRTKPKRGEGGRGVDVALRMGAEQGEVVAAGWGGMGACCSDVNGYGGV